jgi:RHS repeat-associated protein
MVLKNNGTVTKTRWYFGGSYEREQVGSTVTQYIWIGGDAYTAVAVAKKTGTGSWVVYNIFRDHLGTITHLKNGSTIDEYSFDAWGRRRDKDNWSYTLSGEPTLFADRGFTAHEYLADFNLYNMNGRLYDPVLGRFLSPDPYIADPAFTQSYNRYSYVLNNPLKYNDPTGEFPWLAAGIFAAYMYLNNAHANRDQSTGKWAWNPTSWFGKGSNTTVVFGVKTNSDFTDATAFMGIGANHFMPAFAVNSNSGVGFGVYTPQGTDFVYPGEMSQMDKLLAKKIADAAFAERQRNIYNMSVMNDPFAEFNQGINVDISVKGAKGFIKGAPIEIGDKSVLADVYYKSSKNNIVRSFGWPRKQPSVIISPGGPKIDGYLMYLTNSTNFNVVTLSFSKDNYNVFRNYILGY